MENRCQDCLKITTDLKLASACADGDHLTLNQHSCCTKYICSNGCERKCNSCGKINIVNDVDGYYFKEKCSFCNKFLNFTFLWWGDSLKEACRKYCGSCFKDKLIMDP